MTVHNRISVIIPVYNGARVIRDAVESLQKQTYKEIEILVVDDCSTDETYKIVQSLALNDPRIVLLKTPFNMRSGGARNVALSAMTGEWVTLLDADDWWQPDRAEALLKKATLLQADVLLDNLWIYDHVTEKIVGKTDFGSSKKTLKLGPNKFFWLDSTIRKSDSIGYSKPFIKVDFLKKNAVHYWQHYKTNEDYILIADLMMAGARFFIIPEAYYVYRYQTSPTTKEISPHSHAVESFLSIAESCNNLLSKYGSRLSLIAQWGLQYKRKFALITPLAKKQRQLFDNKHYWAALFLAFKHPYLSFFRLSMLWQKIFGPKRF
jgi:succinoglycan biosynthesis protein ExoO